MLPPAQEFAAACGALGLRCDDPIVVYDTKGVFSSARVWFTFRCYGARDVAVLQGGLPLWLHRKLLTESGPAARPQPAVFLATDRRPALVRSYTDMLRNAKAASPSFQTVDARSAGRWAGTEPEPRAGLSSGHMPHSLSVPYGSLVEKGEGGAVQLKDAQQLVSLMRQAGVKLDDPNSPVVTTCGTGVTASVLALALEQLGHKAVTLYDGSWTEWAQKPDSPIEKSSSGSSSAAASAG